jgi:hypothetical protein
VTSTPPEPDPDNTPDLQSGGGVTPGSTPPEAAQTSGLSAPEPSTSRRFPLSGVTALIAVSVIVLVFGVAAVALLLDR